VGSMIIDENIDEIQGPPGLKMNRSGSRVGRHPIQL